MRAATFTMAVSFVFACSGKKDDAKPPPEKAPEVKSEPKKPVDTKPLPPLVKDPGGSTGKPLRAVGFGGLGIDTARGIAVDDKGAAYVAGYFDAEVDFGGTIGKVAAPTKDPKKPAAQAYFVKVNPDGKLAWAQTFGAERDDVANAVAVRGDNVVVVGSFLDTIKVGEFTKKSSGSDDAIVISYNRDGVAEWAWNIGGIDSDGANAVAATPDGGWVIGGSFSNTVDIGTASFKTRGGTDAMLIKLKPTGDLEWFKQFGGAYQDQISHVAVDAQGNIVVQGVFKDLSDWGGEKLRAGGGSDLDVVLAKYDLNGDHLWSQRFGNAFNDVSGGVAIDPSGFITMVGSFDKTVSFGKGDEHTSVGESDIFVVRFSPMGELQWAKTFGADREDIASGVATDAWGNTVTTGWFQQTVDFGKGPLTSKGNKDVFALKLDVEGNVLWSQRFGDKDHDQGRCLAMDAKGVAYLGGIYRFSFDAVSPALESVRAENDRIPKPDSFVLVLDR